MSLVGCASRQEYVRPQGYHHTSDYAIVIAVYFVPGQGRLSQDELTTLESCSGILRFPRTIYPGELIGDPLSLANVSKENYQIMMAKDNLLPHVGLFGSVQVVRRHPETDLLSSFSGGGSHGFLLLFPLRDGDIVVIREGTGF